MTVFLLIVFGSYLIFVLALMYGWEQAMAQPAQNILEIHSIAVIVPFRNEEQNLSSLMRSLQNLNYPKEKLQIILVNDHSSDGCVERMKELDLSGVHVISLEPNESGKKRAITRGIEIATAEIVVTTDADCIHKPEWLDSINSMFCNKNIKMVVGAVSIHPTQSFFAKLQAIEFASLIGSGASMLQWNIPALANGANLAFRREIFQEVNGYTGNEQIASGDDEYLLRKVYAAHSHGVVFNNQHSSVVYTLSQPGLSAFMNQRLRWAGKWKFQANGKVKLIGLLVFLFQLSFAGALILTFVDSSVSPNLFLAKAGLEGIFLWRVSQFLYVKLSLIPFITLQIIYPFYVALTAIGSMFLSFEWKGRNS
jgi:cellulose synthase/poly-beta-1,6-N-acetylglucosamine synthase-like glycosyltransferase